MPCDVLIKQLTQTPQLTRSNHGQSIHTMSQPPLCNCVLHYIVLFRCTNRIQKNLWVSVYIFLPCTATGNIAYIYTYIVICIVSHVSSLVHFFVYFECFAQMFLSTTNNYRYVAVRQCINDTSCGSLLLLPKSSLFYSIFQFSYLFAVPVVLALSSTFSLYCCTQPLIFGLHSICPQASGLVGKAICLLTELINLNNNYMKWQGFFKKKTLKLGALVLYVHMHRDDNRYFLIQIKSTYLQV